MLDQPPSQSGWALPSMLSGFEAIGIPSALTMFLPESSVSHTEPYISPILPPTVALTEALPELVVV